MPTEPFQDDPLLPEHQSSTSKANPYWLMPVVLGASIARGVTMPVRIQVYTDIACKLVGTVDCSSAPAVQARAAAIQASVTTVMSVLSTTTTGPWSLYGDIYGRRFVLGLSLAGSLVMELFFVLVSTSNTFFSTYAQQFVVLGAVLDGAVGGHAVFNGVIHAYTSDCTPHGSRSKVFSSLQGTVFVGLALGPWMAGTILSLTGMDVYASFYISIVLLAVLLAYVGFILPESLQLSETSANDLSERLVHRRARRFSLSDIRQHLVQFARGLVKPIAIFIPRKLAGRNGKLDYNVACVGAVIFLYAISIGVYPVKYLYAKHTYSWSSDELGHYMSVMWIVKAVNLLVLLPIIITYFKPKPLENGKPSILAEMRFDKLLAGCSLFLDGLADFLIAVTPNSQAAFYVFSSLSSFTSGGNPATHSLGAVCLHAAGRSSEVGSLFGAMAFLAAVAHVIAPTMYAVTYSSTVGSSPKAIFYVATALLGTGVLCLSVIKSNSPSEEYMPLAEEDVESRDD
ncbi:major facilitator superfamily domain-containing protein [Mycena floridula]|nr:major facilitator superfamily domain-containing protein [Mycena floridula]